jgi:hypothetical protein
VSDTLSDFLVDLASDPDRMQAFVANPNVLLDQSTLSADEKAAILSRDARAIRTIMGLAPGEASENYAKKKGKKKKSAKKKKTGNKKR